MKRISTILLVAVCLVGIIPLTSAVPVDAYTGVMQNYTNTNGTVPVQILVNVPISNEDTVYPEWLFVFMGIVGVSFLIYSASLIARPDTIPSISMVYSGIIAFGSFLSMAMMSPLVGMTNVFSSVVNGTVYVTQTATFTLSPWVSYACWGFAIAGFIVVVAGVLSFFGWLNRKGIGDAQKGNYLETDGESTDENTYKIAAQKRRSKY